MAVKVETKEIKENTDSLIFWKSRGGVAHNRPVLPQGGVARCDTARNREGQ